MKIAILTLPPVSNYGNILQCYALQRTLESMRHEVTVLHNTLNARKPNIFYPFYLGYRIYKNIKHRIRKEPRDPIFYESYYNKTSSIERKYTYAFVEKYLHIRYVDDLFTIKEGEYDAFIVGSDQVWRESFLPWQWRPLENAFLLFTSSWSKIIRVAYAVSFGQDVWQYSRAKTDKCAELAKKFNAISVREDSGVELCSKYLGVKASHVIDPTLLLPQEEYTKLLIHADMQKMNGDLFVYLLDNSPEKEILINQIAHDKHLTPYWINSNESNRSATPKPPVEQWLKGIMESKFVICDSFHGCVFSIIYNKPFVVIGNQRRGMARFTSLLRMFDLENRLCLNPLEFSLPKDPDYSRIQLKIARLREEAITWIENSIE